MIATIVIVGIALAWLGLETRWLSINLRATIGEFDCDMEAVEDEADFYLSEEYLETCENLEAEVAQDTQLQQFYRDTEGKYPHGKPRGPYSQYHEAQRKMLLANFPTPQWKTIERNRQCGV